MKQVESSWLGEFDPTWLWSNQMPPAHIYNHAGAVPDIAAVGLMAALGVGLVWALRSAWRS